MEIDSTYICRNCLSALKKRKRSLRGEYCTIQKIAHLKTSPAIPLPVNIISMPCSDQPSHSQEQSTKRVALEDLRCVNIEENINSSLATIGAAQKIRAVPGWKTCKRHPFL